VLDVVLAPGFLAEVDRHARKLWFGLVEIAREFPTVFEDARGAGLLLGLKCVIPNTEVQEAFMHEGLLTVGAGDNVVRFAPPLVVTEQDIDTCLDMVRRGARRCLPSASSIAAK